MPLPPISHSAERGIISTIDLVIVMACMVAFGYLHYLQTGKKVYLRRHPPITSSLAGIGAFVFFAVGLMARALRNLFIPYVQGPFRPLTPQEWRWRLFEIGVYTVALVCALFAIKVSKRRRRDGLPM